MSKEIPKCTFCEHPTEAIWKIKGENNFVCEFHKQKLNPKTVELIFIKSMDEYFSKNDSKI